MSFRDILCNNLVCINLSISSEKLIKKYVRSGISRTYFIEFIAVLVSVFSASGSGGLAGAAFGVTGAGLPDTGAAGFGIILAGASLFSETSCLRRLSIPESFASDSAGIIKTFLHLVHSPSWPASSFGRQSLCPQDLHHNVTFSLDAALAGALSGGVGITISLLHMEHSAICPAVLLGNRYF